MLQSAGAGQVGLRAVCNHPKAWHCLFSGLTGCNETSHKDFLKNFWHILEIFHPVQVGNAVYCEVSCVNVRSAQWQRHPGVLGYKRPITMMLSGFFYLSWGIWGSRPISSVSLLLHLIPFAGLAELRGMTESWHKATTCDLIRAPGVLALFCFIFPSAAISFKNVDDFHLFPSEQWSIFDLPTLIKTSKVANFCY